MIQLTIGLNLEIIIEEFSTIINDDYNNHQFN